MNDYLISTDKHKLDIAKIHRYLSEMSYWAKGRTLAQIQTQIDQSMCFGVYLNDEQVGFARVLSDKVTLAYLADVFILPDHQGKGLGKRLVAAVLEHEDFSYTMCSGYLKHKMPRSYTRNTALDSWQLPTDLWCGT